MNRKLRFSNISDVEKELSKLENYKIRTTGLWSYYQILTHSAEALEFSMSKYPSMSFIPNLGAFFIRVTIGKGLFNNMLKKGYMDSGRTNPMAPTKMEMGDEKLATRRLKDAIEKFKAFNGTFALHPVFGKLDKTSWEKLHSMHIANHLGFAHPIEILKNEEPQIVTTVKNIEPEIIEEVAKPKVAPVLEEKEEVVVELKKESISEVETKREAAAVKIIEKLKEEDEDIQIVELGSMPEEPVKPKAPSSKKVASKKKVSSPIVKQPVVEVKPVESKPAEPKKVVPVEAPKKSIPTKTPTPPSSKKAVSKKKVSAPAPVAKKPEPKKVESKSAEPKKTVSKKKVAPAKTKKK